jgi:hypothetical protein
LIENIKPANAGLKVEAREGVRDAITSTINQLSQSKTGRQLQSRII